MRARIEATDIVCFKMDGNSNARYGHLVTATRDGQDHGMDVDPMMPRIAVLLFALLTASCDRPPAGWHATDITGVMPSLEFRMQRASDNADVTELDYRQKIVVLYFGYTHCPDICPATLTNLSEVLRRLGKEADGVRILFVTVDPDRDKIAGLREYVRAFAPQIDGLRGSDDAIASLVRRYRVAYGIEKSVTGQPYRVMHSDAVFVFDRRGRARLVATSTDDVDGLAADLARL